MCVPEVGSQSPSDGLIGLMSGCFSSVSLQIVKEL